MDKVAIKFIADLLYAREILYYDEFEAIMDACTPEDLDRIIRRMLDGEFKNYRRGETISKSGVR